MHGLAFLFQSKTRLNFLHCKLTLVRHALPFIKRSKSEKKYSKMQHIGNSDFKAGGTSKQLHRYIVGVNNGDKVCAK
jgi:hypothetical protein